MKLKPLLLFALLTVTLRAAAQNWAYDSTVMGAGYTNDVFYSMRYGTQKTEPNTTWHMAFLMTPQGPFGHASIWANHVQTSVRVYSLHLKASTHFTTLTAQDTVGMVAQYNTDSSWNQGAFNRLRNPSNLLDYGWGTYDMQTHNLTGDSLFLVRVGAAGTPYKVWIQKYVSTPLDSIQWQFRIAQFDGTGDTTIILRRKDFTSRLFAYYNIITRTGADREPAINSWDVVFTRYTVQSVTQGPTTLYDFPVTGVLSNAGVTVADVRPVNPDTANYQNYARTKNLSEIGSDWKNFNMNAMPPRYEVDSTITYFIKAISSGEYWQLVFTDFRSATGTSIFKKRAIAPTAVSSIAPQLATWYISPNPASGTASIMIEAKEATATARLLVTDLSGRTIQQQLLQLQKGINAYSVNTTNWPAGTYLVHLTNGQWKVTDKLVVVH